MELNKLRRAILARATVLLLERGYRGLSMREIAEGVGVSKAALYYHFKDKEQLFLALLETYLDAMAQDLEEIYQLPGSSREKITAIIMRILARPAEERAVIRFSSQELVHLSADARGAFQRSYHQKFILRIQRIIEDGAASGELRPLDPYLCTWALLGIMYPYFYPSVNQEMALADEVTPQLVSIFLDGLANSP